MVEFFLYKVQDKRETLIRPLAIVKEYTRIERIRRNTYVSSLNFAKTYEKPAGV